MAVVVAAVVVVGVAACCGAANVVAATFANAAFVPFVFKDTVLFVLNYRLKSNNTKFKTS